MDRDRRLLPSALALLHLFRTINAHFWCSQRKDRRQLLEKGFSLLVSVPPPIPLMMLSKKCRSHDESETSIGAHGIAVDAGVNFCFPTLVTLAVVVVVSTQA